MAAAYAVLTPMSTLSPPPPFLSPPSPSSSSSSSSCQCLYPSRTLRKLARVLNPRAPGGPACSAQVLKGGIRDDSAIDKSLLDLGEASSDGELWAASCLRIRTFNQFKPSTYAVEDRNWRVGLCKHCPTIIQRIFTGDLGYDGASPCQPPLHDIGERVYEFSYLGLVRDHKRSLAEREYEALKERIAGTREGFKRVSCINATLPMSQIMTSSNDLSSTCKFSISGQDRVVVASLDLNQCLLLPDEIVGTRPQGTGADSARAYLSNVCVAEELQRNGLGYALIAKSKIVAQEWGITDLYVHVAVDNEAAKNLYIKSGFTYESEEPTWQARFLDRPRRILLWTSVAASRDL